MKTSMSETILIERYLWGELLPLEKQTFKARLLQSPRLRLRVYFQKKVHLLVKLYHRKKLKMELVVIHEDLFSNQEKTQFQEKIHQIFQ